jgi:hypothetical protein
LPGHCVPTFPRKNKRTGQILDIPFLHWYQVQDILNQYAPGWQGEIVRTDDLKALTVTYRLTLLSAEGRTSRDGIGCETRDEETIDYGDRASNALADAIKKAGEQFGIGIWLKDGNKSLEALEQHFLDQQAARIKTLGEACEQVGLNKKTYKEALISQAGVTSWKHIPVAMLQEALACVEASAVQGKA